jgi:hypothetical protein
VRPRLAAAGVALGFAALSSIAFAQAPVASPSPAAPSLEIVLDPPGQYQYDPENRRDPFVSLLKPVEANRGPGSRPEGIEGLLIQELALKGIVKTAGGGMGSGERAGYIALLVGNDGKTYFANVGQSLFNGRIIGMDDRTVSFCEDVTDPITARGLKKRLVTKTLYPSDEAAFLQPRPCP